MKSVETLQVVNLELKAPSLNRVLVFSNDSLMIAGRKMVYLTNADVEGKLKNMEEVVPLYAHFNGYFKVFMVVTKFDVRIFSWMSGQLVEVQTKVLEDFKAFQPMVTCYHEGPRTRKLYIGDNTGRIRQYNMKGAEFIRNVNDPESERQAI
jgi:hypothetical protein